MSNDQNGTREWPVNAKRRDHQLNRDVIQPPVFKPAEHAQGLAGGDRRAKNGVPSLVKRRNDGLIDKLAGVIAEQTGERSPHEAHAKTTRARMLHQVDQCDIRQKRFQRARCHLAAQRQGAPVRRVPPQCRGIVQLRILETERRIAAAGHADAFRKAVQLVGGVLRAGAGHPSR